MGPKKDRFQINTNQNGDGGGAAAAAAAGDYDHDHGRGGLQCNDNGTNHCEISGEYITISDIVGGGGWPEILQCIKNPDNGLQGCKIIRIHKCKLDYFQTSNDFSFFSALEISDCTFNDEIYDDISKAYKVENDNQNN